MTPPELRRPGKASRETAYDPWTAYGVPVAPGTAPIMLYLRLSKVHRIGDAADSIERQREDLRRKIATEGKFTIVGEYADNDSASSSASRVRKGWTLLNLAIEAGDVTAVGFWKLDRTNRVAARLLDFLARCRELGVTLVSHEDSADHLNRIGGDAKLLIGMKALMAEVETDTMSTRQLASKRHAAEAGFNHGGATPFGWQIGAKGRDELGRTGTKLEPHPVEFKALQDGVRMILEDHSLNSVARHWRDAYGIVTATGALLPVANVRRYLKSPRLVGYRMRQVPEFERGVRINQMDFIARDAQGAPVISQQAVCDEMTWRRLQRKISEGHTGPRSDWGTHQWLLTKVLVCVCGNALYGRLGKHGEIRSLKYSCTAKRRLGPASCPAGVSIPAEAAEAFVLGWLFEYLSPARLAQADAQLAHDRTSPVAALVADLDELRSELTVLKARQGTGRYKGAGVGALLDMMDDVRDRMTIAQRQVDALTPGAPVPSGSELEAAWPAMTLDQKRAQIRRTIDRIEVKPGRGSAQDRLTVVPRIG